VSAAAPVDRTESPGVLHSPGTPIQRSVNRRVESGYSHVTGKEGFTVYVDSGSGSMIISAVVAGAAGAGVVAKMQWRKLTGAIKGNKATQTPLESATTDSVEHQTEA
jgi:hypothetical protein